MYYVSICVDVTRNTGLLPCWACLSLSGKKVEVSLQIFDISRKTFFGLRPQRGQRHMLSHILHPPPGIRDPNSAKFCLFLPISAIFCKIQLISADISQFLLNSAKFCTILPKFHPYTHILLISLKAKIRASRQKFKNKIRP